ncbi:hypothetical protein BDV19DRAFT_394222 [Aspergillus venezuelensis]
MSSSATRIRMYLDSLWRALTDDKMDARLEEHNTIPQAFLNKNDIRIIHHVFQTTDHSSTAAANLFLHPPILFCLQPPSIFSKHPIDPSQAYTEFSDGTRIPINYNVDDNLRMILELNDTPLARAEDLAPFIEKWAMDGFSHSFLPENVFSLARLCNVLPLWITRVDAFIPTSSFSAFQASNSTEGKITQGELTSIVTAMRNRSRQSAEFDMEKALGDSEDEDLAYSEDRKRIRKHEDYMFADETRFPIIMISLLGPQNARIIYAYMDSRQLFLRMSSLMDFSSGDTARMELVGGVLLSSMLKERQSI